MSALKPFPHIATLPGHSTECQTPEPEKRQLTVMFCDLVGYTALSRQLDPEDLHALIRAYQSTCAAVIARYEGCVARYMGDGIMIHFGYPCAREDDVERAVSAALDIVEAIADLNVRLAREDEVELAVRIGIATGVVIIGDLIGEGVSEEQAIVGQTPNLAARLQGAAAPNTVVIDSASKLLLGDLFEYHGLGPQALKGFEESVWAWQVLGTGARVTNRFDAMRAATQTPSVGHAQEAEYLLQSWQQAQAGPGHVVLVSGEAGIGKSRLLRRLCRPLARKSVQPVRYQCSPNGEGISLRSFVRNSARATGCCETGGTHPRLIIIEDVHWLDAALKPCLDRLVDTAPRRGTLVLITSRSGFCTRWLMQAHVSQLSLGPLSRAQSLAMVKGLSAGTPLPEAVMERIVDKSDGVPLFIEEVTKCVLATRQGHAEMSPLSTTDSLSPGNIPLTLRNILMACLDRLPKLSKQVVQIAAVIGRGFSYDLLNKVACRSNIDIDTALEPLLSTGLVVCDKQDSMPTYAFKHVLVQEIVYASLLKPKRQQLQACIAQVGNQTWENRNAQIEMVA